MLQNQPTATPDITNPVLAMLKVEPCQGMSSYSTLFLRWWDGREGKGRTLACVEQVLVPGVNGRMFNRKSVSSSRGASQWFIEPRPIRIHLY